MSRTPPTTPPFKFGHRPEASPRPNRGLLSSLRIHRLPTKPTYSSTVDKGKTPIRGSGIYNTPLPVSHAENRFNASDKFGSYHTRTPSSSAGLGRSSSTNMSKKRGSLLVAASDALGLKFSRKKQTSIPARYPPNTTFLPDIIEITAHRTDAESEERERLREEAAHCLGISVDQDNRSAIQTTEDDLGNADNLATASASRTHADPDLPNYSTNSLPSPTRSTTFDSRRSDSALMHYRKSSAPSIPIPQFPASVHSLQELNQLSSPLPKYYPPNNLRIFSLSKNWKARYVILTSPAIPMSNNCEPAVSYLHVFKSSASEEREIERLEINEQSVVFIAEEDVGGRSRVIKVGGGEDFGARKGQVIEDDRITWFFHIPDVAESQTWIAAIKNVILVQRTIRAGLRLPSPASGIIEPRGDMDVMLSIRQQGIGVAPSALRQSTSSAEPNGNYASSTSSQSVASQTTGPKSLPSTSAGIRSLFIPRPRVTSRATSLDSERERDSFLSMGHLMSRLRPSTANSDKSINKSFVPSFSAFTSAPHSLERKILNEHVSDLLPIGEGTSSPKGDRPNRALSLGSSSLHPPPRKRRGSEAIAIVATVAAPTSSETSEEILIPHVPQPPEASGDSPPTQRFSHFGSPQQRPRVQSANSVSTIASGATSQERSSVSTKRSSRRWSRQSVLPARLNPPSGPPPPAPSTHLQPHPYAAGPGVVTSIPSNESDRSSAPGFASHSSKRTSTVSVFSTISSVSPSLGTTASRSSHPTSNHRSSMLPSKPAPTSALPPAPAQAPASPSPTKPSFRESVAVRVGRLSMIAPKPAPTVALPPRPDERQSKSYRRASSGSYFAKPTNPNSSTSSLTFTSSHVTTPPLPPPSGPLPPTPNGGAPQPLTAPLPSSSQSENLISRRFRMLSAPASSDENPPFGIPTESSRPRPSTVIVQSPRPLLASLIAKPPTPISEQIMSFQDDPSFLQFDTPTISPLPPPRALQHIGDQSFEMTSLSPPPRRSSRQIFPFEVPDSGATVPSTSTPKPPVSDDERGLVSLSRPGSVVSLGIVTM